MELNHSIKIQIGAFSNREIEELIRSHVHKNLSDGDIISPDLIEEIKVQSQGIKFWYLNKQNLFTCYIYITIGIAFVANLLCTEFKDDKSIQVKAGILDRKRTQGGDTRVSKDAIKSVVALFDKLIPSMKSLLKVAAVAGNFNNDKLKSSNNSKYRPIF